jgi:membrane-bound ClpP family serine protease
MLWWWIALYILAIAIPLVLALTKRIHLSLATILAGIFLIASTIFIANRSGEVFWNFVLEHVVIIAVVLTAVVFVLYLISNLTEDDDEMTLGEEMEDVGERLKHLGDRLRGNH